MDRSRCKLHVNKLRPYKEYCISKGWREVPVKSIFESLRMVHPNKNEPLIVHRKLTTKVGGRLVHYTIWGQSYLMFQEYIKCSKKTLG